MVISTDRAHVSCPIDISPIAKQLVQAHNLSSKLSQLAGTLGDNTPGGLYIKALSYSADLHYQLLNSKFETITFYLTRKQTYGASKVFEKLSGRQIPLKYILPDHIIKQHKLSFNALDSFRKRHMASPDDIVDMLSDVNPEDFEEEEEDDSTTVQPEPEDPQPDQPETDISWKALYEPNADFTNPFEDIAESNKFNHEFSQPGYQALYNDRNIRATKSRLITGNESFLKRSKRQLFTVVASLLASVGVSSIFGGIDASKLNSIQTRTNDLTHRQGLIIHEMEHNSKDILVNRNMINGLAELTEKLSKFVTTQHFEVNGLLVYILMTSEFTRIEDALNQYVQIVEASSRHEFHPSILSHEAGISAFNEIKAMAEARGLTPIINNAQQLSQLRTHYSFTPTGIELILEIPLCSPDNSFALHQFDALPIKLGPEAYINLISDFPIIGIGELDTNGKAKFVEMSFADLAQCQMIGKTYLCTQKRIVKRSNAQSCIYALYQLDHEQAQHTCTVSLWGKEHTQVVAVGPNDFSYYNDKTSSYRYKCQNRTTTQNKQLQGITNINVPSNCIAETSEYILHGQSTIYSEAHPNQFEWSLPSILFMQNDTTIKTVKDALAHFENSKTSIPLDPKDVERYRELNKPFYEDTISFPALTIAGLALLLIIGIISIIVYKNHKANRAIGNQRDPKYRFNQLLKNEENVEFLEQLIARRSST